jgi:phospholipase/carboxylesterase
MPRSMLIYQEIPEDGPGTTLIGLHGRGGDLDQLVPLAEAIGSVRLIAPQAARPVTPATQAHSRSADGFTWFFQQNPGHPEPATFGEGLWMIEQFIYDVRDRQSPDQRTFLVGFEQGGVLAATLAAVVPEALAGVAVITGYLPDIPGWAPPMDQLNGLPVLLVHDPTDAAVPEPLVDRTATELAARHASVERKRVEGASRNPLAARDVLSEWLHTALIGP